MLCRKCKKEIPDNSVFCNHCGAKQEAVKRSKGRTRGNGEGTVYQRGKTWTARVIVGWWVDDNCVAHPHLRTKGGFKTKKEALDYIPELKKKTGLKQYEGITLQKIYDMWYAEHETKVSEKTMEGYRSSFKHFKPIMGMPYSTLTTDDMQKCLDTGDKGRRTKENMRNLLTSIFKFAAARQIVTHNYAQYLYVGNEKKGTHPAFTTKQIEQIREAAAAGDVRAIYTYCLIYLGFRPGEMFRLTRSAYHNDDGKEYLIGGGKTEAGTDRTVPISPKIKPYIYKLILKANPYIFAKEDGKPMNDKWFRLQYFYPLLADLGIQPLPDDDHPAVLVPYSCRHTFANLLKNVDGANKDKASLIGHTDYAFTEEQYQSSELECLVNIVNKL